MPLSAKMWEKIFVEMLGLSNMRTWKYGQEDTIRWMAKRLKKQTGVLVADEVGMGKTRVVMAAILAVLQNGGSVATVVPPGLIYQWKKEWDEFLGELIKAQTQKEDATEYTKYAPIMLRSYSALFDDDTLNFPLAQKNNGKWLLISHQFSIPTLKTNSQSFVSFRQA